MSDFTLFCLYLFVIFTFLHGFYAAFICIIYNLIAANAVTLCEPAYCKKLFPVCLYNRQGTFVLFERIIRHFYVVWHIKIPGCPNSEENTSFP